MDPEPDLELNQFKESHHERCNESKSLKNNEIKKTLKFSLKQVNEKTGSSVLDVIRPVPQPPTRQANVVIMGNTPIMGRPSAVEWDVNSIFVLENRVKFKNLTETYKMNTFLLTLSCMYPNPRHDNKRKILIGLLIFTLIPVLTLVINDIHLRIQRNDMPNLVRQSIILVAVSFVILKLILTIIRRNEMNEIFNKINEDYKIYNNLPDEHQQIVEDTIRKTKLLEKIWIYIMTATASSYPVLAGVCTVYSSFFSENPRRFMVHEVEVLFLTDEEKYESPYFEIIAAYSMFIVWVIFIGFTGYDGMFTVCIQHVSLKIKLLSLNLKYLFIDTNDVIKIKRNIANFVEGHCEIIRLVGDIQKCYEVWLAGMFFISVVQIGMALSQVTADAGSDINAMYYLFVACTIVYIYMPCYLASGVTYNAAEVANFAYSSSWETVTHIGLRKSVCIIIARAQIPIHYRALGMLTFNMEMFVSILQTAYSMYTLLKT